MGCLVGFEFDFKDGGDHQLSDKKPFNFGAFYFLSSQKDTIQILSKRLL